MLTDLGVAAAAGMVFVMVVFGLGPTVETTWFPVYSKFKLLSVERVPPNHSLVKAEYVKYRDCTPIGVAWYNAPVARDLETGRQLEYVPRRQIGVERAPSKPVGKWETLPF